jgi:hypothetical protein
VEEEVTTSGQTKKYPWWTHKALIENTSTTVMTEVKSAFEGKRAFL